MPSQNSKTDVISEFLEAVIIALKELGYEERSQATLSGIDVENNAGYSSNVGGADIVGSGQSSKSIDEVYS